tara:strand:+ start:464 stop:2776 length:2313 start_codon:yes stop_codon:yes gene_type:complete
VAKLPQYKREAPLMQGLPELQTPQFNAQINKSESLKKALGVVTDYAKKEGTRQVIDQASQFTVSNPLTIEDLDAAQKSGVNPIAQALNGGMIWNDAVKKLYAGQASTELSVQAYHHFDDTLARVDAGGITDADEIREAMEAPIKGWTNVIAQIDPAEANRFYMQSIIDGKAYYKKALSGLRAQEQLRQDDISLDKAKGLVRAWEVTLSSGGIAPEMMLATMAQKLQDAKTLFNGSSKSAKYVTAVETELTTALYKSIATSLEGVHGSSEEVVAAIDSGKLGVEGALQQVYDELWPTQKEELEAVIVKHFKAIDDKNTLKATEIGNEALSISKGLLDSQQPNQFDDKILQLELEADTVSGSKRAIVNANIDVVKATKSIVESMGGQSFANMDFYITQLQDEVAKGKRSPLELSIAQEYRKNAQTQRDRDPVLYELKNKDGAAGDITTLVQGTAYEAQQSFKNQLSVVKNSEEPYSVATSSVLTKTQLEGLNNFLNRTDIPADQIIKTARNVVEAFGDNDSLAVFRQLEVNHPAFAQVGNLASESYEKNQSVINEIVMGGMRMKANDVKIPATAKDNMLRININNSLGLSNFQDTTNLYAAADAVYFARGGMADKDKFDTNLYEQSIQSVAGRHQARGMPYGGFTQVNGSTVLIPDTIPAAGPQSWISYATVEDILAANVTDNLSLDSQQINPITKEAYSYTIDEIRQGQLKNDGEHYIVLSAMGAPIILANGETLKLDMNILQDIFANKALFDTDYGTQFTDQLEMSMGTM